MNMEELKKKAWVKWLAAALVAGIGAFAGVQYVEASEVVCLTVPEDKKVLLAPKKMPKDVVSVKAWKLMQPTDATPQAIPAECENYGELVVSPTLPAPEYCAQYFPEK